MQGIIEFSLPNESYRGMWFPNADAFAQTTASEAARCLLGTRLVPDLRNSLRPQAALLTVCEGLLERCVVPALVDGNPKGATPSTIGSLAISPDGSVPSLFDGSSANDLPECFTLASRRGGTAKGTDVRRAGGDGEQRERWHNLQCMAYLFELLYGTVSRLNADQKAIVVYPPCIWKVTDTDEQELLATGVWQTTAWAEGDPNGRTNTLEIADTSIQRDIAYYANPTHESPLLAALSAWLAENAGVSLELTTSGWPDASIVRAYYPSEALASANFPTRVRVNTDHWTPRFNLDTLWLSQLRLATFGTTFANLSGSWKIRNVKRTKKVTYKLVDSGGGGTTDDPEAWASFEEVEISSDDCFDETTDIWAEPTWERTVTVDAPDQISYSVQSLSWRAFVIEGYGWFGALLVWSDYDATKGLMSGLDIVYDDGGSDPTGNSGGWFENSCAGEFASYAPPFEIGEIIGEDGEPVTGANECTFSVTATMTRPYVSDTGEISVATGTGEFSCREGWPAAAFRDWVKSMQAIVPKMAYDAAHNFDWDTGYKDGRRVIAWSRQFNLGWPDNGYKKFGKISATGTTKDVDDGTPTKLMKECVKESIESAERDLLHVGTYAWELPRAFENPNHDDRLFPYVNPQPARFVFRSSEGQYSGANVGDYLKAKLADIRAVKWRIVRDGDLHDLWRIADGSEHIIVHQDGTEESGVFTTTFNAEIEEYTIDFSCPFESGTTVGIEGAYVGSETFNGPDELTVTHGDVFLGVDWQWQCMPTEKQAATDTAI